MDAIEPQSITTLPNKYRLWLLLLPLYLLMAVQANGQSQRTFKFNKHEVSYYFHSNMTASLTAFPNHQAKLIVSDELVDSLGLAESIQVRAQEIGSKDDTLYYYLSLPKLKNDQAYVEFLEELLEELYNRDFFDRNTTMVEFQDNAVPLACSALVELNKYFATVQLAENSRLLSCGESFVVSRQSEKEKRRTSIHYENISIKESVQKRERLAQMKQLDVWENAFFVTLTYGRSYIDPDYTTYFDEETLVDIEEIKAMWGLTSGYMFTNEWGGLVHFGLKTQRNQSTNFDGVNVSGSGNGVGLFKLGVGGRYIPFAEKRWSIYGDVHGGLLRVRAQGGTGSGTLTGGVTRNISSKSEATSYISFLVGTNYRLGNTVYFTTTFDYTLSEFENNIGSISGFTGYSINLGLGFSF